MKSPLCFWHSCKCAKLRITNFWQHGYQLDLLSRSIACLLELKKKTFKYVKFVLQLQQPLHSNTLHSDLVSIHTTEHTMVPNSDIETDDLNIDVPVPIGAINYWFNNLLHLLTRICIEAIILNQIINWPQVRIEP